MVFIMLQDIVYEREDNQSRSVSRLSFSPYNFSFPVPSRKSVPGGQSRSCLVRLKSERKSQSCKLDTNSFIKLSPTVKTPAEAKEEESVGLE